jgi:hypothetical protein
MRVPKESPPPPTPTPVPGRKYAEAELEPSELQDLVEGLSDILKAGAGLGLRFVLRLELADRTADSERVAKLRDALAKVSAKLKLE